MLPWHCLSVPISSDMTICMLICYEVAHDCTPWGFPAPNDHRQHHDCPSTLTRPTGLALDRIVVESRCSECQPFVGIRDNERADELAGEAASLPQEVPADARWTGAVARAATRARRRTWPDTFSLGEHGAETGPRRGLRGGDGYPVDAGRPQESVTAVPSPDRPGI